MTVTTDNIVPLEDRLGNIKRLGLDLTTSDNPVENECHRPSLSIRADFDETLGGAIVSLCFGTLMGQPFRWADMTPTEARILAKLLGQMADAIEYEVGA